MNDGIDMGNTMRDMRKRRLVWLGCLLGGAVCYGDEMMNVLPRIRWDNVGLLVLSAVLAVYGVMIENYYALAWQAVAMGLAVALLKERARCIQARLVAIHFAEKNGLFDKDKKDGNTKTRN